MTNGFKHFFFFEPITWGKGRNCTKNFVKWVGTLNHRLENIGDFFLGNMVTHHHPSSWLVKEEEEESSEPKTWASQARCAKIGRSQGFQGGNRKRIYWRAFKRLCTYIYMVSAPTWAYIYIYISIIYVIYIIVYYVLCTMYYVLYLYLRCVLYHIYIYIIMYSIYYLYIIYIYIRITCFFQWLHDFRFPHLQADTPHPQRCDALCLADVTWLFCCMDQAFFALKNDTDYLEGFYNLFIFIVDENNDWCCVILCIYMYVPHI